MKQSVIILICLFVIAVTFSLISGIIFYDKGYKTGIGEMQAKIEKENCMKSYQKTVFKDVPVGCFKYFVK